MGHDPSPVLALDDESGVLASLTRVLVEELDIEPLTTTDPRRALAMLEADPPKVLLTDFQMPEMDGVTVLREARRLAPDTIRILLTARAEQANIVDAINRGRIFRFIAKPWDNADLASAVREALQAHDLAVQPAAHRLEAEAERRALRDAIRCVRDVQRLSFPEEKLALPTAEAACFAAPYEYATGDYLDVLPAPGGRTALLVGDVAGHGVDAALVGFAARALLRFSLAETPGLASAVQTANRFFCRDVASGRFMTLFVGLHDPRDQTLTYVNAGHPPALVLGSGGLSELSGKNLPLGLVPDAPYQAHRVSFRDSDLLLAYTDGLTEARDAGRELFGERRVRELLGNGPRQPAAVVDYIRSAIGLFVGDARAQDDLSLLAYRPHPVGLVAGAASLMGDTSVE